MNLFLKLKEMFKNLLLIILLIFLYSCQSVKDALSGKKYESSDEFLVIKKNPLVLPPDFNALPKPKNQTKMTREENIEMEIDEVVSSIKSDEISTEKVQSKSSGSSTEDFVLEQIKN